jgi:hypothetical protein
MKRSATISPCGTYRFDLMREIEEDDAPSYVLAGTCAFLLNNPSVADADREDNTSRRGIGYTIGWGYARMIFANSNPYRSTNPRYARIPPEDVLAENDRHLVRIAKAAEIVVCAWGDKVNPTLARRAIEVVSSHAPLYYLALSERRIPRHPLMLKKTLRPILWTECLKRVS